VRIPDATASIDDAARLATDLQGLEFDACNNTLLGHYFGEPLKDELPKVQFHRTFHARSVPRSAGIDVQCWSLIRLRALGRRG
jgi:hypothetical protein